MIYKIISVFVMVTLLSSCLIISTDEVSAYGYWEGNIYSYESGETSPSNAGTLWVDYWDKEWEWQPSGTSYEITTSSIIIVFSGTTSGWDLLDNNGELMFEGALGEDSIGKFVFVEYENEVGTTFFGYLERRVR